MEDRLADLRGSARFAESADGGGERQAGLPVLGTAPDFTGNQRWFNTPGDAPLDLHQLRHSAATHLGDAEEEATVKWFSRRGGHVQLLPDNPAFDPIDGDQAQILGKVVAVLRRLR